MLSWVSDQGASLSTASAVAVGTAKPLRPSEVEITGIDPASGPVAGGTEVRIRGRFGSPETAPQPS